jgi:tryptophan synthase alpha chain
MLTSEIRRRRQERDILLMTHIVIGYPNFDDSLRVVEQMVAAGVDLMELQVPFSEPIADGPVILHANQESLLGGATVDRCFEFAAEVSGRFDIPFVLMTYYNILFKPGVDAFARRMSEAGLAGAIVPDLPPEEAEEYVEAMQRNGLAPVFIFSPNTTDDRMGLIAKRADGFVYCVARKGVTGAETAFSDSFGSYLTRCRAATELPLALGFGVKSRSDIDFLRGQVDIAVVGTETLRVIDEQGVDAVGPFIEGLR